MGGSAHTKVEQVTERGVGTDGADDNLPLELLSWGRRLTAYVPIRRTRSGDECG